MIRRTPHVIGQRIVDQGAHHGDWIGAGPFRVRGDWLRVDVRGQDPRHRDITAGAIHGLLSGRLARRTGPAIGNLLARALLTKAQAG